MYLIGYDIGSSSIKAAMVNAQSGKTVGVTQYPSSEMEIMASQPGWAEQYPETWWENVCHATKKLLETTNIKGDDVIGIGISYQMHGLVLVDKNKKVLRPSIIWCDSRAVEIGNNAFAEIGEEKCLSEMLNSPGNFTASKLKWVKDNEPKIYAQIDKMMLPGDYIAMKLTDEICTTASGLSEGILWDFQKNEVASTVLDFYEIKKELIPNIKSTFSVQGKLTAKAAVEVGLSEGTPVGYRAGDQPNNALCLNVLNPGEVAATGGTSGVVYGVVDKPVYDLSSRVNGFAHVNHSETANRIGILLCINGAGIQYSWIKQMMAEDGLSYTDMEQKASEVPVGSDGLRIIPFGNGAERILKNDDIGAQINNLQFNRHSRAHFYRAALEGIAFSYVYGMHILKEMGIDVSKMRVGNDNLFQSPIFSNTISTLMNTTIDVIETTGAVGAAKGAGFGVGVFSSLAEAMSGVEVVANFKPQMEKEVYEKAYEGWRKDLERRINAF